MTAAAVASCPCIPDKVFSAWSGCINKLNLSDTGKMNHANTPENLSYFHFNVRSLGKNKHKLDDFFQMTEVNPTFIAISETKLKPNFIVNINIPGFNFVHNPSQTN